MIVRFATLKIKIIHDTLKLSMARVTETGMPEIEVVGGEEASGAGLLVCGWT